MGIVALALPKGYKNSHLVLNDSIKGTRLEEGGKLAPKAGIRQEIMR